MNFRKTRKTFFTTAALVTVLGGACTRNSLEDSKLNIMHLNLQSDVKTLDPANAYDSVSNDVGPMIYESLYQYSYLFEDVQVEPLLAADMPKYSADRLTLTIPIKKGVMFSDDPCFKATNGKGRELVADDFIYSIKRLAIPDLQSQVYWLVDGRIVGISDFAEKLKKAKDKAELAKAFSEPVEGLKAIDDHTLQIKLTKPYPQLKYALTMQATAAVPHEAAEAYADEHGNLTDKAVGTGPYVLKEWSRHQHVVLDRNPSYHPDFYPTKASPYYQKRGMLADAGKPLPFADRIIFEVYEERQPAWLNFKKGNQDATVVQKDNFKETIVDRTNLTPEFIDKGVRLTPEAGSTFYYISFNMKDKLMGGNKYLRQALSAAINRDEWIDLFTGGTCTKMVSALPPGLPDRPKTTKIKYDFDLAKAKELLKKAGYPDGKGLPTIKFDLRGASTIDRQLGDFIKREWEAIGVQTDIVVNTFPAFIEKAKQANFQVAHDGWGLDYPDAENVYQLVYGPNKAPGPNDANYDDPEMNKLYDQMANMESGPKRQAIIQKMDDLLQEDCPWIMGYYYIHYDISQPWLLNYRTNEVVQNRHKYARVDKDIKKRYTDGAAH